jgi:DNA-directed RNA polymerase-3 subunit RPC5
MTNAQYLDAISAPSSGKGKRKTGTKRADDPIEISDESDDDDEQLVSERIGEMQATDDGGER